MGRSTARRRVGSPRGTRDPPQIGRSVRSCLRIDRGVAVIAHSRNDGGVAKVEITFSIEEDLLRRLQVRATRTGRTRSDVLEEALRQGLDVIERIRAEARLPEERALDLASEVVHEIRAGRGRARSC
jgi:predicted DNA-binding protein